MEHKVESGGGNEVVKHSNEAKPRLRCLTEITIKQKIYCDQSRFKRPRRRDRIWDWENKVFLGKKVDLCTLPEVKAYTQAHTDTPDQPSSIQLCPRYLSKLVGYKYLSTGAFERIDNPRRKLL